MNNIAHTGLCVAFTCSLSLTGLSARPKALDVPLKWTPNQKVSLPAFDVTGGLQTVTPAPIADKREKSKSQIGENTEEKQVVPITTRSDVPQFVADAVSMHLKALGIELKAEGADRIVTMELLEFWVTESDTYQGQVRVKFSVTDAGGQELWGAVVNGAGENWGRSLKPINYTETLSNALQDLMVKLAGQDGFSRVVKKSAAGP